MRASLNGTLRDYVLTSNVLNVAADVAVPARTTPLWAVRLDAADTIRDARKRRGLTQRDLGLLLGLSLDSAQTTISRLERGDVARMEIVVNAAAALGLGLTDVLELRASL